MKQHLHLLACKLFAATLLLVAFAANNQLKAQLLAFPGAEGYGKYATGGRTGSVYHVTNLNNSGAGSLRDAVSASNRIVVFDVAGVIKITERMVVAPNIYLAGQTAPGEGITVYGNGWSFSGSNNTICRYMKIRMGIVGTSGKDANGLADGHDVIFDHCSVSWGRDENFSINSTTAQRITIQNCIISQGLLTHSAGGLIQNDGGITLYRNLYADNGTRNNKVKGVSQYVNNIVYNWKAGAYIMGGDSQGESFVNAVSNCFIQGPVDGVSPFNNGNAQFHIYAADNISDSNRNGIFDPYPMAKSEYNGGPDFQAVPYNYPVLPTVAASKLLDSSLPTVGASLPYRDYVDYYVTNEVKTLGKKGELIANENVLPFGAPTTWPLWAGTARIDTDKDGMPDDWEKSNGTNPAVNDAMTISASGYTNIENYINGINTNYSQPYLRAPMNLKADSANQNNIFLSWFDYTEQEQGYIVEQKINGVFVTIGTTGINNNHFTVSGLKPEEIDTFRVKAFNANGASSYSNVLVAKSKPIEVPVLNPTTFVPDLTWSGAISKDWDKTTQNWLRNNTATSFTDSSSLLFPFVDTTTQTINLTAQMGTKDVLVNGNYTFSGTGNIAGTSSVNKIGSGTLTLNTNNTYTGATVLREGTLAFNKLANGGAASAIGASPNYGFNWVWKGGKLSYTGGNVSTDRNAIIDATTEFNVSNATSTVTLTGVLSGDGGLIKSGPGRIVLKNTNPYAGETVINGGVLEVTPVSSATLAGDIIDNNVAIGTSNVLRLHNGIYRTSGGSTTIYENYPFHLYVDDSTVNGFEPFRNANLNCTVSGNGTLNYVIPYLRELIQGDWSDFTGTLATTTNTTGALLLIDNGVGFPSNRIVTGGTTKIASYQNNETLYIGGLSGIAGTMLSTGGTKTATFGNGYTTYSVGAAGTDETFNGVINDQLYGNNTDANGTTTIIKEGNGLWRLTGKNTYKGTTTIIGGKLIINGTHSGTGKITVNEGTILAGKGSVAGDVTVSGTLEPGDSAIGTFTLKGKLALQPSSNVAVEINQTKATWDKLAITGATTYGGTLNVAYTGAPAIGNIYKLFTTASTASGTFAQIVPAPAAGMLWKFNAATGELSVIIDSIRAPSNISLSASTSSPSSTVTGSFTDNSNNELYFIVERSTDSIHFTDVAHPLANATSFSDAGLLPNTTYYYRIKAHGATSESLYSAIVAVTTPNNPLPLHLRTFTATNSGNNTAILHWTTSNETNMLGFTIESSTNGSNFTAIGQVAAKTNSLQNQYAFNDVATLGNPIYYRLKMINNDGSYQYSPIVQINTTIATAVNVYPNPTNGSMVVSHPANANNGIVRIYTLGGKLVKSVVVAANSTQTLVNVQNLANGTYLLVLNNGKTYTLRFVKQ